MEEVIKKAEDAVELSAEEKAEDKAEEAAEEKPEEEEEEEPVETMEEVIKKAEDAVELSAEEKAQWFLKGDLVKVSDLTSRELSGFFPKFSIPSKEGFDEIRFVW